MWYGGNQIVMASLFQKSLLLQVFGVSENETSLCEMRQKSNTLVRIICEIDSEIWRKVQTSQTRDAVKEMTPNKTQDTVKEMAPNKTKDTVKEMTPNKTQDTVKEMTPNKTLGPVHTGCGGARKCCLQKLEHIVPNGSVHTALLAASKDLPANLRANLLTHPV